MQTRELAFSITSKASKTPKNQVVLEEDDYVAVLNRIIERDFFPDLPKLRLNVEWQQAVKNGDVQKMRDIQRRYENQNKTTRRPGAREFETPNFDATPMPNADPDLEIVDERNEEIEKLASRHTLDSFQQKFTSQDNASFSSLMDTETESKKKQNWWREGDPEKQLLIDSSQQRLAVTWKPDHHNSLMFPPKGLPGDEPLKPTVLETGNTRFQGVGLLPKDYNKTKEKKEQTQDDFPLVTRNTIMSLRQLRDKATNKKIKLSQILGGDEQPSQPAIPTINGYELIPDPTPRTGMEFLDLQTPIALGGADKGPTFSVQDTSKRDQVGIALANQAQANMRRKAMIARSTPVTSLTPRTTERGQRLAQKIGQSQSLDSQLRASYNTPNIRTPARGIATPVRTPVTTRTKRSISDTVRSTPNPKRQKVSATEGSLTDNLL